MSPSAHATSANRLRLLRARRQRGLRCFTLEIRKTEIDALVGRRLLPEGGVNDPQAIRDALYLLLDRQLGGAA